MSFPFVQADYDYIDEKIRNREEFTVEKKRNKVPGKNNVWIDFTVKGWKLNEDTWKRNGIWSEPYLLSFDDFMYVVRFRHLRVRRRKRIQAQDVRRAQQHNKRMQPMLDQGRV